MEQTPDSDGADDPQRHGVIHKGGTIGLTAIPFINQVWDTPACDGSPYTYGYICCAPTSSCMMLAWYGKFEGNGMKKWVSSRSGSNPAGGTYYSNFISKQYTSCTGYTFNKYVSNQGGYWGVSNNVAGGYGYMWGYGAPLPELSEGWNLSEQRGNKEANGFNAGSIRNFTYMEGKLYCVYVNSKIIILNAQTGKKMGELSTKGVDEGTLRLCDVKAFGGKIYACNLATTAKSNHFRIYRWDNDTEDPKILLNTTDFQGADRLGDAMEIVGTPNTDAWFCFVRDNDDSKETRIVEYHQTAEYTFEPKYTKAYDTSGNHLHTGANARAYPNGGRYWIDGNAINPMWCTWDGGFTGVSTHVTNDLGGQTQGVCHHEFYYHGWKYAAPTDTLADRAKNGIDGKTVKMPLMAWNNGTVTVTHRPTSVGYLESNLFVSTQDIAHNFDIVLKGNGQSGADDIAAASAMRIVLSGSTVRVSGAEASDIRVYNLAGALVAYSRDSQECSVAGAPTGAYIVAVTGADGAVRRVKFHL